VAWRSHAQGTLAITVTVSFAVAIAALALAWRAAHATSIAA